MPVRLVVTDMDGTLYSWIDYIVPAVESMVDAVGKATGFPRLKVVQSLKAVYTKYESNEYPSPCKRARSTPTSPSSAASTSSSSSRRAWRSPRRAGSI